MDYLLKNLGLEDMKASDKLYEEYSLGMRARLALSRAPLNDPPILILDEPTLELDSPSARTIRSRHNNLINTCLHNELNGDGHDEIYRVIC